MTDECPECGFSPLEPKKTVEDNEVKEDGLYCPDCKAEYDEDQPLCWDDIDFPVWIEMSSYNDNWELYRKFLQQTGLPESAMYDNSEMKYAVFRVYYKVCEDGTVEGPYDSKNGEKL